MSSCTPLPKVTAEPVWANQLTRLLCLEIHVVEIKRGHRAAFLKRYHPIRNPSDIIWMRGPSWEHRVDFEEIIFKKRPVQQQVESVSFKYILQEVGI